MFESALNSGRAELRRRPHQLAGGWQQALGIDPAYLSGIATTWRCSRQLGNRCRLGHGSALLEHADPAMRRHARCSDKVRRHACRVLGLPAGHAIDAERALARAGSRFADEAVELRNSLASAIGKPLPSTLIFSYPSTGAIAEYLATQGHGHR